MPSRAEAGVLPTNQKQTARNQTELQWSRQGNCEVRGEPRAWLKPAWKTKVMQANKVCTPRHDMASQLAAGMTRNEGTATAGDDTN